MDNKNFLDDLYYHTKTTICMLNSANLLGAKILDEEYKNMISLEKENTKNFVLLSPDHFCAEVIAVFCQKIDKL